MSKILEVKNLSTSFLTETGKVKILKNISFSVEERQTFGIVGESGSGKSITAYAVMRLLPQPYGKIDEGEILFKNQDLVQLAAKEMLKIRGAKISMIFQEPMTALNPVYTIGKQLLEVYNLHFSNLSKEEKLVRALNLFQEVGIKDAQLRFNDYPHQFSGGMRQRVMIAFALACEPDILICDEPTTALDVTIQAQILKLIKRLQQKKRMAVIFITHDLGVVAQICDKVAVMYKGEIVEQAKTKQLFTKPKHNYTKGLLASIPTMTTKPKVRLQEMSDFLTTESTEV